jgi:hypothetical protein
VLLLLETGLKKEELFALRITHFDFSNAYAPELWVKHTPTAPLIWFLIGSYP